LIFNIFIFIIGPSISEDIVAGPSTSKNFDNQTACSPKLDTINSDTDNDDSSNGEYSIHFLDEKKAYSSN
jgi:hypothetical protein